jgi:biopolymer transport protein ExbB
VAQALITTAAGLGIAIFSVFPFNYFNAKVDRAVMEIESTATSLEIVYEKQAHAIERRPGAAP